MEGASDSNIDWENPSTYQSLAKAADINLWLAAKDQVSHPSSSKVITAFVQAMSDPDWLKEGNARQSLEGIKIIPLQCPEERHRLVKAIAESGAKNIVQSEAKIMLTEACNATDWDLAIEMLSLTGPVPVDDNGNSALHLIAEHGTPEQISKACDCLLQQNQSLSAKNDYGNTPIHLAVSNSNSKAVELLLLKGADLNALNGHGRTPLHMASKSQSTNTCLLALLNAGAKVNVPDHEGTTPLHLSSFHGNTKGCEHLIQFGANPNVTDKELRAPIHVNYSLNLGVFEALNKAGANLNLNRRGDKLLGFAIEEGDLEKIEILVKLGADINARDDQDNPPLFYACFLKALEGPRRLDVISLLVKLGADVNAKSEKGTLLTSACARNESEVARLLVKLGVDVNATEDGITALGLACFHKNFDVARLLVISGAKMEPYYKNWSPLELILANASHISSEAIDDFIRADGGFTAEILERKLLAHRFGLEGSSSLAGNKFDLEGMVTPVAISHLQTAVWTYYAELKHGLISNDNARWMDIVSSLSPSALKSVKALAPTEISNILDQTASAISDSTDLAKITNRYQEGLPVGIATGLPEHSLGIAVYNNRLARCNRGYGSEGKPGVVIHTIGHPTHVEAALKKFLPEMTEEYFITDMKAELGLKDECYLAQKYQKVGNCAVANSNSMELALLYLQLEPLIGAKAAEELSRAIKKGRTTDTRIGSVQDYLNWHRKPRTYPPDLALLGQLHQKRTADQSTDRQVRYLIQQWADDLHIDPDKIVPGAIWHR